MTEEHDSTLFEAEQAVLSAMMMDEVAIGRAQKHLEATDFVSHAHRAFFNAMTGLHADGIPVDPLTLSARMELNGTLQKAGGKDYIAFLVDAVPTAANVEYHARLIIQERDRKRAIGFFARATENLKNADRNTLREIAQEAQEILLPLALDEDGRGFQWITKEHVDAVLHELDRRAKRVEEGLLPGIPSGYAQIDRVTQGFRPKEFVVIGGVPKSLKSYLVLNILLNAAYMKIHGGLVSAEMDFAAIMERALAAASLTSISDMGRGSITATERERIVREGARLENWIAIDDEALPELGDVVARCTELKAQQPRLQIIAVDYIQLVQNKMAGRRGDEEINGITRALKGMAKRLEVVVIAPAQANYKEVEARPDKRCQLRDFQGASGMVQDGDLVATIYNERQYSPEASPVLEINFQATRRVGMFTAYLDYDPRSMAIYEKKQPAKVFGESAA